MNWQPIESAPKDGREILAFGQVPREGVLGAANPYLGAASAITVTRWRSRKWEDYEDAGGGMFRKVERESGGWEVGVGSLIGSPKPTHWQPLPDPAK